VFQNSGTIVGQTGTGLLIDVSYWYGDVVNSGLIDGAVTGASFYGEAFEGDIINNGDIIGGQLTTGLNVAYSSFTGDIVNNVLLSAPGNALHIEVDTFTGDVVNTAATARIIPPLRGALLASDNREVQNWTFAAKAEKVEPGQRVRFETTLKSPSMDATDVKVTFALPGG